MPWKEKLRSTDSTHSSLSTNSGGWNSADSNAAADTRTNGVSNASATVVNSSSLSSSLPTRHPKQDVPFSTLHTSAQQWSYERGAQSAATTANQIEADMLEVRNIIANYAVEPLEILHLIDRWLQQLLSEFHQQRDHFKHRLREHWYNQELTNLKYDNNDRMRKIYAAYKELEQARDTILSRESFDQLNSYLGKTDGHTTDEIKQKFNILIEQYFKILQCLHLIDKEINTGSGDNYINDIKDQLLRLKKLNDKPSHTICIVGLEKAGKSTFINALLGYELLPTASERCTQIRTVLKPHLENGDNQLFATVKFYDNQEFQIFYNKMVKRTDENEQQLLQRKQEVFQGRESLKAKFPEEHFRINGSNDVEKERKTIIKQLNDYITGEVYVNIIKEVAIYTDKLPGKNYELLDVPGFDSPIKEHRDAGLEAVKLADAFLFLTNGQQPSLTEPQVRLLHEIQQNHFEAMQRAFESWDEIYYNNIFEPAFAKANYWHTTIVTKERAKFIDDIKQKFRDSFFDLTKEFVQRTFPIEQLMFEKFGASKLQLNVHPIDTDIREKLSIELEKIVNKTSSILAEHLYHKYICELENILNNICPQLKDLYRTKLTLEKCTNETHALILRVCRPVIIATLRYSYLDLTVKQDALNELICIAPMVAFNIANTTNQDGDGLLLGSQIRASAELLADRGDMTTSFIKILFKK